MIISDLYQTKIEATGYNVDIDSTNTVITVSLIDFNGAPVTGKSVTLSCDRGYFNKNGSTTINGTSTKSITATTDNNGKITATWTASDWGLATFTSNNSNIQINVGGWRTQSLHSTMTLKYNQDTATLKVANSNVSFGTSLQAWTGITIPDGLRPGMPVTMLNPDQNTLVVVKEDGSINRRSITGSAINNSNCYVFLNWHY